jgi:hypothetical protein
MSDDERDTRSPQLRLAHRFELAARDMEEAAATADWLAARGIPKDLERPLLTGLIVTYARPFGEQGIGAIATGAAAGSRMGSAPAQRTRRPRPLRSLSGYSAAALRHTAATSALPGQAWGAERFRNVSADFARRTTALSLADLLFSKRVARVTVAHLRALLVAIEPKRIAVVRVGVPTDRRSKSVLRLDVAKSDGLRNSCCVLEASRNRACQA